jgi:glycosyltransferase involved in cell wall biosynthesis
MRLRKLPEADVLLTSSYAFAHGLSTRNAAPQLCYCYSPLRFAWSMTGDYEDTWAQRTPLKPAFRAVTAGMRAMDRSAAKRVDRYVAESRFIADQLADAYGINPDVIHPPVDCELFTPSEQPGHDDYFLFSGRLVEPYKRPGLVIEAFRGSGRRLLIAGDGPAYKQLRAQAGPEVEFLGRLQDDELVPAMQRAAATVFPSVDDFGLIPVESMACGRPVLAFAGGGALETVVAGETGEFFTEPTVACLREALDRFDPDSYDPAAIRAHAEKWDKPRFQRSVIAALDDLVA